MTEGEKKETITTEEKGDKSACNGIPSGSHETMINIRKKETRMRQEGIEPPPQPWKG